MGSLALILSKNSGISLAKIGYNWLSNRLTLAKDCLKLAKQSAKIG